MKRIMIQGTQYPFRLTIGAMMRYKELTGEDFSQFKGDDMQKVAVIIQCGIRSACRAEGVPVPQVSLEELMDYIDLEQVADLLSLKTGSDVGESIAGRP